MPTRWYAGAIAAGALAAVAYALSPLTFLMTLAAVALVLAAGRGLPDAERRWLHVLLGSAIALRFAVVAAIFLFSEHDTQGARILSGDEAYALGRTLRMRNLLAGLPGLKYDYVIAFDLYGQTSYLKVMTIAQMLFGPSPYGLRLLNSMFFVSGAVLLFRLARRSFGTLPAFGGLVVLLFLPTLFLWSISLLKESLYFLLTSAILAATVALCRERAWRGRVVAAIVIAAGLYAMRDLRGGAVALIGAGLAAGLLLRFLTRSARRFVVGSLVVVLGAGAALQVPSVQQRVVKGLEQAAAMHIGHVFTVGHHYKLLDEGFYATLETEPKLTPPEAARFAVRGLASFFVVPLPGDVATRGELMQLPELWLWYVMILLTPFGIWVGLKQDPLVTCLFLGYVLPTALVVALTNGNVGTLVRLRGLVTPYVVWLACLGFCVIIQHLATNSEATLRLHESH